METTAHSALVTGATSGLGYEAATQLAERDRGQIIVTGRTEAKARDARDGLRLRTGRNVFESLALDLDDNSSVEAAADALIDRGGSLDLLILNAGLAPPSTAAMSHDGIERTVTSSLVGHHILVARLLQQGLLDEHARIVIAGSEAARGDVPTFHPLDFGTLADDHFGGDWEAAVEAQMRLQPPATYKAADQYATAKMMVAWWAAELSRRLPQGMTVNAVSPGSTPGTNAIRNAPFYMKHLMVPIMKLVPGMSHDVADGARRYLEASDLGDEVTGQFFASPPKRMTGKLTRVELAHIADQRAQRAGWRALVRVSGVDIARRTASASPARAAAKDVLVAQAA
jgi:NAD(P)-dependent dehydrogenase (short-subunit alcohol dehydrogenase family)